MRLIYIHRKFWHASAERLIPLLVHAGVPTERLAKIHEILALCECHDYDKMPNRPQVRTSLATRFNEVIEADHFQVNGSNYLLIVDRLYTFKGGGLVNTLSSEDSIKVFP